VIPGSDTPTLPAASEPQALPFNDPEQLLTDQYRNAANLNARIELHRRFSTNRYGWMSWVFDHLRLATGTRILELGCGAGSLWAENLSRLPTSLDVTLSDFSPGMLEDARRTLGPAAERFRFEVINAQEIPYPDLSFDAVIANHMLYHVPDRERALAAIHRVLRPAGRVYASTVGREHLRELDEWRHRFGLEGVIGANHEVAREFGLETGGGQLERWFSDVKLHVYDDALEVTEVAPLVAFICSSMTARQIVGRAAEIAAFTQFAEKELARRGSLHITKASGIFEGTY
jgi:SAM-dependent methyltransferase